MKSSKELDRPECSNSEYSYSSEHRRSKYQHTHSRRSLKKYKKSPISNFITHTWSKIYSLVPEDIKKAWKFLLDHQKLPLFLFFLLWAFGLLMVQSASMDISAYYYGDGNYSQYFVRQLLASFLGACLFVIFYSLSLDFWYKNHRYMLLGAIAIAVLVLIVGKETHGAKRWISLGGINIQVIEPVKLLFFVYLSGFLVRFDAKRPIGHLVKMAILGGLFVFLLVSQPDFKSAMYLLVVMGILLFLNKLSWKIIVAGIFFVLILGVVLISMQNYRLERLVSMVDGQSYQYLNALQAIKRGGWFGNGWVSSIQKYGFLPEPHNDFIFAVMIEEWGALFSFLFLCLYVLLILYCFFRIANSFASSWRISPKKFLFTANLGWSLSLFLLLNTFIHVLVNIGMMPVTGISFPLLSYGGSLMVFTLGELGILFRMTYEHNTSLINHKTLTR